MQHKNMSKNYFIKLANILHIIKYCLDDNVIVLLYFSLSLIMK